jgi:hypothetical protein
MNISILLVLAFLGQADNSNETVDDKEIIVVGEKLDRWRGEFSLRGDKFKCKTKRSSGDEQIDPLGCQAIRLCIVPLQSRLTESDNKALGVARQKELKKEIFDDLGVCVKETRAKLVADFVAQRKPAT